MKNNQTLSRCPWPKEDPLMCTYHDTEWGVPVHDDLKHFEFLVLDTFQAGLSWSTILKKRDHFRKAFDGFDFSRIAKYDELKVHSLLSDQGIIRNRLKILATIENARMFLKIREEYGTFDRFIWQFTGFTTLHNHWTDLNQLPARTDESDKMSTELKKQGFRFVGSTICYAYMQAAGMVNDHTTGCFRYKDLTSI